MRRLLESTSSTCTSTSCPGVTILEGATFFLTQLISDDMHETFDAGLQFHESAVIGDVGDLAAETRAGRIFGADAFPRIGLQLLHAEADALRVLVDLDDLHGHGLAYRQHFGRMADAAPGDVGDMQEAVDAAQIDERAVIGDVLHHAFDDLLFGQARHQRRTFLGAAFFEHGAARNHDIAAAAVHLEYLEKLRLVHQRPDIAHGTHIDLTAGQEGYGAVEIDGEAALDPPEDNASHAGLIVERLFES